MPPVVPNTPPMRAAMPPVPPATPPMRTAMPPMPPVSPPLPQADAGFGFRNDLRQSATAKPAKKFFGNKKKILIVSAIVAGIAIVAVPLLFVGIAVLAISLNKMEDKSKRESVSGMVAGRERSAPSEADINSAVRDYCDGKKDCLLPLAKLPRGTAFSNEVKITLTDLRLVKRGTLFRGQIGFNPDVGMFPVRVHLKGTAHGQYGTNKGMLITDLATGDAPIQGEMDFHVWFEPPDESKVEPGPGKWRASVAGGAVVDVAPDDSVRASISTTDLSGTKQRMRELFAEMENELSRARDQGGGNEIAVAGAIARAKGESQKKIEGEFSKLDGETIQWRFTVNRVTQSEVFLSEAPTSAAFSGNTLYIYFGDSQLGYLPIGKNMPMPFAEKLRPGDQLLIKGRAQVRVGTRVGPFSNSRVNEGLVVAIQLSELEVRAADMEQEQQRQTAEGQVAELTRRRTASRDAVLQRVRRFLSKGSVLAPARPSAARGAGFQYVITGDMTTLDKSAVGQPLDEEFRVPAHAELLGDSSRRSSGMTECDGIFVGQVNELNDATGTTPQWRVTMHYSSVPYTGAKGAGVEGFIIANGLGGGWTWGGVRFVDDSGDILVR
jgi:hypothetical protein